MDQVFKKKEEVMPTGEQVYLYYVLKDAIDKDDKPTQTKHILAKATQELLQAMVSAEDVSQ